MYCPCTVTKKDFIPGAIYVQKKKGILIFFHVYFLKQWIVLLVGWIYSFVPKNSSAKKERKNANF